LGSDKLLVLVVAVLAVKFPVTEAGAARVAGVWHYAVFANFVSSQLAGLGELPVAQVARERLLVGVDTHVPLEILAPPKPLEADDARERLVCVSMLRSHVRRQRVGLAEALAAQLTLVRHTKVFLEVLGQVALINEPLAAEVAPELRWTVHLQVAAQVAAAAVAAAAHVAHKRPLPPASTSHQRSAACTFPLLFSTTAIFLLAV